MELDREFREFVECCVAREVRFLVVGGYAVAAHGHPRYTKDLEVWVWLDPTNAERVALALSDFGFASLGLTAADFEEPDVVIQLGYPPKRIDILTSVSGVEFDACFPNRVAVVVPGLEDPVPFISVDDLIANKTASGRLQDLADIEALSNR